MPAGTRPGEIARGIYQGREAGTFRGAPIQPYRCGLPAGLCRTGAVDRPKRGHRGGGHAPHAPALRGTSSSGTTAPALGSANRCRCPRNRGDWRCIPRAAGPEFTRQNVSCWKLRWPPGSSTCSTRPPTAITPPTSMLGWGAWRRTRLRPCHPPAPAHTN